MKWEKTTIGKHCTVTSSKRFHLSDRSESGIPFYCSKEIIQKVNGQEITDCDYIKEEAYEDVKKRFGVPEKDDLLITTRGTYGLPYIYKETDRFYFADGNLTWLKDFDDKLSVNYLYYWILSYEGQKKIDAIAKGTAQKAVPIALIRDIELAIPPLETQHRIASILSAYDDLIENNQKQIKLLEEAAQRLYKEWFVDLRFPGYENVKIVDGVPEGWKIEKIGNFVSTTSGGTPSRTHKEYYESGTNLWVKTQELKDSYIIDTDEKITDEAIKKSSAKIIPNGSLLLAMYGATIGKLGIANCDLTCNQACCVFLFENDIWKREYLYCWLIENRVFLVSQGKGAAQPNLSQALIKAIDILIPNENLVKRFSKITSVMFQKKCNLEIQIKSLNEARDRLLPKVMSGEIEV